MNSKGIKQIKQYRLIKEIGKGATAIVFEAVDDTTNKICAIKAISTAKLKDKRIMENFKRELKLLHGMNHPNIIKISGVEKTINNVYLILEYCNGGNLYEYSYFYRKKHNSTLPEKKVQSILKQLIEGLEYMHNSRTIHRDIKLENILINFNSSSNTVEQGEVPTKVEYAKVDLDDITVKIADLGYARELEGVGLASTICGTPITMAPDIVNLYNNADNKHNMYNTKADLWSLGAITYELITGQPPFYAGNYKELFELIMDGKYDIPRNLKISIEAITFINGLLQFYPEKRMTWNEIRTHPFIINDTESFRYLDLHSIESNYENHQKMQVDTKDCNNFLWILYRTELEKLDLPLDKIDDSIYQNPVIAKLENNDVSNQQIEKNNIKFEEIAEEKKDDSEDDYEDANNELNLCNDEQEIPEKSVSQATNNENETKSSNRVFDKIFSEVKQELKNSSHSSDKEIITKEKSLNDSKLNKSSYSRDDELKVQQEYPLEDSNENKVDEYKLVTDLVNNNLIEHKNELIDESNIENPDIVVKDIEHTNKNNNICNEINTNLSNELTENPSYNRNIKNSKESQLWFDSISEERETSFNNKLPTHSLCEEFIQVQHENRKESNDNDTWEIISTTSIIEHEIQLEIDEDGYQVINEYFK